MAQAKIVNPGTDQILYTLKEVIDPELGVNIVDLGLVYDIRANNEAGRIAIDMTLTTHGCPLGDVIFENIHEIMKARFPDFETDLNVVWNPPWSPNRISPEGRNLLEKAQK